MSILFESFLATPEAAEALSDLHVVATMLRIEAALVRAQASVGLTPLDAAQSIIGTCKVELFDVPKLVRESVSTRNLATPLIASLRETVALFNPQAAGHVHKGCSDHELVDTALALLSRELLGLMAVDLRGTIETLLGLATRHADDAMLQRSPAAPVCITSFGLVCSQWVTPLVHCQQRLLSASHALELGLGSDLLSLADMRGHAPHVLAAMAADLQLALPDAASPGSNPSVTLACELGLLVGNLGKMAADMAHLMPFEINELTQLTATSTLAPGAKRMSPAVIDRLCLVAHTAAQRVPHMVATVLTTLAQESSQTPGSWQARLTQWPALLSASHSISQALAQLTAGLQANTQRMRSNLETLRASLSPADARARFSSELLQQAATLARSRSQRCRALFDLNV